MTSVYYPAHKLCAIDNHISDCFLAATGSCIQTLSLAQRQPLSIWPRDNADSSSDEQHGEEGRPSKRAKLDNGHQSTLGREASELSEASIEIKTEGKERQKGERRKPKVPDTTLPYVSHLIATADGRYAIAVTAENKAIKVFRITAHGRLQQLSSRCMPKKLCAIALSADEQTIFTADKFGDVYAIPMHPSAEYRKPETPQPETHFKPSATELTVHTKGNLESLRQQQIQKQRHAKKEGPAFEHNLLLGHVSLLTDLVIATGEANGKARSFILTSDRDEHVRVSRGMPQAHIIQSFCLGHTEFVSKLCIVPSDRKVLVCGNGEPSLRVYDWQIGRERSRYDIVEHLRNDIESVLPSDRSIGRTAVSGIWPIVLNVNHEEDSTSQGLLVALEGLPLVFLFRLKGFSLCHIQTVRVSGNVLDVLYHQQRRTVVISIDGVHVPGTYKSYRDEILSPNSNLECFRLKQDKTLSDGVSDQDAFLERCSDITIPLASISAQGLTEKRDAIENSKAKTWERLHSPLGEFVYGLENLRKRRGKAVEEDEEEAQDGECELEDMPKVI